MPLTELADSLEATLVGEDAWFTGCNTDSRSVKPGEMFIALHGARFDGHEFVTQASARGACAALVERTLDHVSLPLVIVDNSRKAMGRIAGLWRQHFDIPLVAVTGSNGKTTVKEMLSSILIRQAPVLSTRGNLNNDIGVPLTLFGLGHEHRYAVIEMGANHKGEIACLSNMTNPTVALITQCAAAHLEGFGSVEGVALAKAEIFQGLAADGIAIVNADDSYAAIWMRKATPYRQISFGIEHDADVCADQIHFDKSTVKERFRLHSPAGEIDVQLSLPGQHNIYNALAAAACCTAIDIPLDLIKTGLEMLQPFKGRLRFMKGFNQSSVYDDTYNANPASLEAALKVLSSHSGRRWLVLGDMGELGVSAPSLHRHAGEVARASGVERLYALGQLSKHAVEGFGNGARHFSDEDALIECLRATMDESVTVLVKGSRAMAMENIVTALTEEC
ncbi:MAG: UDP-N-acetylmuramoyl-tripeptide--D-alanyl-D-alanine ligase [Gammaproteobacteria bacterium]